MATNLFGATSLTGGGSGSLDSIKTAQIADGDVCFVVMNSGEEFYVYTFDSGNAGGESSPTIIYPDDAAGTEAWLICDMTVGISTVLETLSVAGATALTGNVTMAGSLNVGASTAITSILDEDAMGSDSAVGLATQQSIKKYVDDAVSGLVVATDTIAGLSMPTIFTWSDVDTITLQTARYHHNGTTEQMVKWDAALTFDFGSGGSNAGSTDLGASEWHYLYIDDSALAGATITAARLLNSTTAPTWNASEVGWYNGNDKCIGAFYSNASSQLDQFFQVRDQIMWDAQVTVFTSLTTSYVAKTFRAPAFATTQRVAALVRSVNTDATIYYQHPDGSGDHFLHSNRYDISGDNQGRGEGVTHRVFMIDANQQANFKESGGTAIYCYQDSYFLPRGM